jgi:hypothetical protein
MSDQYEEAFGNADEQNITYIQYIHQNDGDTEHVNFQIIPNPTIFKQEEIVEENLCDELVESGMDTIEVLESVVNIGKRPYTVKAEGVEKKLVQISDAGKPKGRKRAISDQTRAIRKIRANTNKAYVNAKGKEVMPKTFDEFFVCSCPKRCTDPKKLSLKTRRQIFNMFWSIGSYEGRCAFLNSCVNEAPKKKQYTKSENSRRRNTRRYTILTKAHSLMLPFNCRYFLKGVEVCKHTFVKTLQISNSRIDVSLQKMENEASSRLLYISHISFCNHLIHFYYRQQSFTDERGKKRSGHGFGEETKEAVIAHIKNNFNEDSSLRGLWNFYQTTHPECPVSESYYKRIFYENFNLKVKRVSNWTKKVVVPKEEPPQQDITDDSD